MFGIFSYPNLEFKPFDNILTSYSIYDAYCDNVILNPNIKWLKSNKILSNEDILSYCKYEIEKLHYKKIIVWCGMINLCVITAKYWKNTFLILKYVLILAKNKVVIIIITTFQKKKKCNIILCLQT